MSELNNKTREVEELIRDLQGLGKLKPLSDADLERARQIMIRLKQLGFSNKQIAEFSDGGWTEPTVKGYTSGVNVSDASAKEIITNLLTNFVKNGLNLEDVETAVSLKKHALRMGVDFPDIAQFLSDANQAHENTEDIIQLYREIKGKTSVAQLRETQAYKDEIEKSGYSPDNLKILADSVKALGDFPQVMSILTSYGSLKAVEDAKAKETTAKETLAKQIDELRSEVGRLKEQRAAIEGEWAVHQKLEKEGYSEAVLTELSEMSARLGGVKVVVEGVSTFVSTEDLKSKRQGEEKKLSEVETNLKTIQIEHAHLQSVVSLCDELLYKHGFSTPSITALFKVAKKFGQPVDVLDAVQRFGDLKAIEAEVERLTAESARLHSVIREARTVLEGLNGERDELFKSLKEALKPLTAEMRTGIHSITEAATSGVQSIGQAYQRQLQNCEAYAKRLGELSAKAGKLEAVAGIGELVAAAVGGYAKGLPLRHLKTLVFASYQYCTSRGYNPEARVPSELRNSSKSLYSETKAGVKDLLYWAWSGIPDSEGGSQS